MATIPDIYISADSWTDVYTESGITVGTAIQILNKGSAGLYIQEGTTAPDADSTDGRALTDLEKPNAYVNISSGSDEIWVRSATRGGRIHVEEI